MQTWQEPFFVTLTAKSVRLNSLNKRMGDMNRGLRIITTAYRKKASRGKAYKLIGIKSLECNFNPEKGWYNPHLHIVVANENMADILIYEWQKLCTSKFTFYKAQKKRKVDNTLKDLIEIIKYGSKIFTEPDVNKKIYSKEDRVIYVKALNNIFNAMKGLRIFDRFGFNLQKVSKAESKTFIVNDYEQWIYEPQLRDWLNSDNDVRLSNYQPPIGLIDLLINNINLTLE